MGNVLEQVRRSVTSVAKGMGVTLKNYTREKVTLNYPDEKPVLAERYRGLHGLTIDPETGEENCIGCMACARVCPDNLIQMSLEKREGHSGRYPVTFQIDLNPCCFCGLCSEVCPTPYKALIMTHDFELATASRSDLILTKDKLMSYARQDQVGSGDLPADYNLLSKEQRDDYTNLDAATQASIDAARDVREAVAIINPLDAKPKVATSKQQPAAKPIVIPATVATGPAFEAPIEPDYTGMDKVARARAKAAFIKAKRAYDEQASASSEDTPAMSSAPVLTEPPVEPDYSGMERVERAKAKAAFMKAKRAYDEQASTPSEATSVASVAPVPAGPPVEPDYSGMERVERAKAKAAFIKAKRAYDEQVTTTPAASTTSTTEAPPVEPDYSGMERVERAKAKSAYIKAKKAWDETHTAAVDTPIIGEQSEASPTAPVTETDMPTLATTNTARLALLRAIAGTGIAERGSGLDAGMAAEAEGLSPETQRALAASVKSGQP